MKKLAMGMVLLAVASLMVVGCGPSQAGDDGGVAASAPTASAAVTAAREVTVPVATAAVVTEPATPEPGATESVTPEPRDTGEEMMPEGPAYPPATPPGGGAGGIADVMGGGGLAIVYERSGGFAGVMERTEIYRDGRVVMSDKGQVRELQVPGARVSALLAVLEGGDFADLAASVPPSLGGQGADRFAYSLTVVCDGKPVQVSWEEGQSGLPAGLMELVGAVQELIRSAQ